MSVTGGCVAPLGQTDARYLWVVHVLPDWAVDMALSSSIPAIFGARDTPNGAMGPVLGISKNQVDRPWWTNAMLGGTACTETSRSGLPAAESVGRCGQDGDNRGGG
jgi:hypothetical protein